jgi:hypothetical protein
MVLGVEPFMVALPPVMAPNREYQSQRRAAGTARNRKEGYLIQVILLIWQLPQNILGYIISRLWVRCLDLQHTQDTAGARIYIVSRASHKKHRMLSLLSGFSLGRYICLDDSHSNTTIQHEIGHYRQSQILGPLYLPIVGIASAVFCNLWDRWFHKDWSSKERIDWYYSRFPEQWADKLGGVDR